MVFLFIVGLLAPDVLWNDGLAMSIGESSDGFGVALVIQAQIDFDEVAALIPQVDVPVGLQVQHELLDGLQGHVL